MAVDYGEARTGIAVSDPTGSIAGDAWTIEQRDRGALAREVASEASSRGVAAIVVGLPKNMDGTQGAAAERSAQFADTLRDISKLNVTLWDERLTTVDAHRILSAVNRRGKKRKRVIDAVAATLILDGYLRSFGGAPQ
jgi:putative Holliday junction resolvase